MTRELAEPHRWAIGRWGAFIALVLTVQLGLIFWLGKPHAIPAPVAYSPPPAIRLAGPGSADVLALSDPTLFALPNLKNFSGPAWLSFTDQDLRPSMGLEAPSPLALGGEQFGTAFQTYMSTNEPASAPVFDEPEFQLRQPAVADSKPFSTMSTLRLAGDLAGRRLINPPTLPSWPSAEILTNTVVEVLVAADGKPISPTLHVPSSGSAEADRYALNQVRKARFEPLLVNNPADPLEGLMWGQFVFEWQTVPLSATNNLAQPAEEK
jgi:hypothetical protein